MRKTTFEVFQNISNIILAFILVLIFIYLQRVKNGPPGTTISLRRKSCIHLNMGNQPRHY